MIYKIYNKNLVAEFYSKGAELFSLNNGNIEFIWNGDSEFWAKHSPILFPIVGTLKNNSYTYNNKKYSLSRHGFARDLEFDVISNTNDSIMFSLKNNTTTLEKYPFIFEFTIEYTLLDHQLLIKYNVQNNSKVKMPFAIGAHPAFALAENFTDYSLAFYKDETLIYSLLENGLISDKNHEIELKNQNLKLDYNLFRNDALVFKTINSKSIVIHQNNLPYIKINFTDFPNLGIWTIKNAKFICIEPWYGYSDTIQSNGNLLDKEAIKILDINENLEVQYSIEIMQKQ